MKYDSDVEKLVSVSNGYSSNWIINQPDVNNLCTYRAIDQMYQYE